MKNLEINYEAVKLVAEEYNERMQVFKEKFDKQIESLKRAAEIDDIQALIESLKCTGEMDDVYTQNLDNMEYLQGLEICVKSMR